MLDPVTLARIFCSTQVRNGAGQLTGPLRQSYVVRLCAHDAARALAVHEALQHHGAHAPRKFRALVTQAGPAEACSARA